MQQRRAPSLSAALSLLRRHAGTGREEKQAGGHEEPEQSHRGAPADIVHSFTPLLSSEKAVSS